MEYTSKEVYEYVSKKTNDPIVERKKCRASWQDFPIYQSDLDFYDRVSPTFEVDEWFAKDFLEKNSDVKDHFECSHFQIYVIYTKGAILVHENELLVFIHLISHILCMIIIFGTHTVGLL